MAEEPLPRLDPVEAIAWFRAKGYAIAFDWRDVWQEENVHAFTVAKAMTRDVLEDIRAEVDRAESEGLTLAQFTKALRPRLQARGWWGKALMDDPATGETKVVQLGSPARLRTIYETNLRTSYMAGKWQRIERTKKTLPFLRYVSVMDGREREEHHAWHGTILPVDHPWWDTHYPPCGWGCRCDPQQLSQRMMDRRGLEVNEPRRFPERDYINKRTGEITKLERGIDPGWSYNVGKAPLDGLTPAPRMGGGGSDLGELQAQVVTGLSDAAFSPLRGFFSAFGLATRAAAVAGKVWTDPAGWPLAISAGLLRGADGAMVPIGADQARALTTAARVLQRPDTIGWVWVTGKDRRAMLVRRYRSAEGMVDMGGSFWRWRAGATRATPGLVVWSAEAGELQAFDPRQARHPKGSRDGGRFRSSGRPAARAALKDAGTGSEVGQFRAAILGTVSPAAAARAKAQGIDIAEREVRLDRSAAVHTLNAHGAKAERAKGERAMTGDDLLSAHRYLETATSFRRSGTGRDAMPRLEIEGSDDKGGRVRLIVDQARRRLHLVTMFHPVEGGRGAAQKRGKAKRRKSSGE